jgi:predicted ATPase/DNA-binding XRE family transcriptional regulator
MTPQAAFSGLLREHRRAAGYSQEELADRAGVSVAAVGSLERGLRQAPHRDTVRALADALNLSEPARKQFEEAAARARGRQPRNVSGLPASLTSFIERNEVDELRGLVVERRLMTITGSPGIGKTRIAIEVARRIEDSYDETCFVDLLPIRDLDLVASQIALRLNVPVEGDDGLSGIIHHLRSRRTLLVIDNCEHVIADAARVVQKLLPECPLLTVFATSREALAHSGELIYRLPPMDSQTASDLFVARVHQADSTWSADAERLAVVADICKVLDGIPLAIELAASRVASLGLAALRNRLKGGITLTGSRDLPERHQTMTATIAWSYDLLIDVEALLFRRLSVLVGGFTLELAESVGHGQGLPAEAIADVLSRLVQKSLVSVDHQETSTRYGFLESIRTFALQLLMEAGEHEKDGIVEQTMLRLMEWLSQQAAILKSGTPESGLTQLRKELDNVAAAISWALSTEDGPAIISASRLFIAFQLVWAGTSRQMEFRGLGLRLLDCLNDDEVPELVGLIIHGLSPYLGEAKLLSLSERAIPLLVATGRGIHAGELHAKCAQVECLRGDVQAAERHLRLGQALFSPDDLRRTRWGWAFACNAGFVHCILREFDAAKALLIGLEIPPEDSRQGDVQRLRASIEFHQGNVEIAIELLSSLKTRLDTHPELRWHAIQTHGDLAEYYLYSDNIPAAEAEIRACLNATLEARNAWMAVDAGHARHAALVAARCGRIELAVRLLGAAEPHHLPEAGAPFDSGAQAMEIVEAELSPAHADALRGVAASEDLYDLFEEFLAQPAASESTRLSATSSPRATSVTRSSPNWPNNDDGRSYSMREPPSSFS